MATSVALNINKFNIFIEREFFKEMKRRNKFIGILLSVAMLMSAMTVVAYAEDVNAFPPQRPAVGNMKVAISDDEANIVVGLRTNGTINVQDKGYGLIHMDDKSKNALLSLTNIVDVDCTFSDVAALRNDGTVYTTASGLHTSLVKGDKKYKDADAWTDIVAIACGGSHLVGLKSDGTVVATGLNNLGQCNVSGWNNVSKIYAINNTTLAIRKDGTILACGEIDNYNELRKVKNAVEIVPHFGSDKFIVLFNDGTTTTDIVDISLLFKETGNTQKIKSIKSTLNESANICYYVLDELGDLYSLQTEGWFNSTWKAEKIEENILDLTVNTMDYYAWDENGQILSNAEAFTSDDWILTTNITYNGNKIDSDVPPYVKDGRTLAPIRAILEALGMTVSWDGATQTATAVKADITISVTINSNIAIVNGKQKTLDVPAEITNGRTFVPVRFFGEALGMTVDWDGYTKTVIIESK